MNGKLNIAIDGCSMEPVLKHRQITRTFSFTHLIPGRCYIYKKDNTLIAHRLIGFTQTGAGIFAGDNCYSFEIIPVKNILAVVDDFRSAPFHAAVFLLNRIVLFCFKHKAAIPFHIQHIRRKFITFLKHIDILVEGLYNHGKKI